MISLLYVPTWKFIYIIIHSGWSLAWIFMKERVKFWISNKESSIWISGLTYHSYQKIIDWWQQTYTDQSTAHWTVWSLGLFCLHMFFLSELFGAHTAGISISVMIYLLCPIAFGNIYVMIGLLWPSNQISSNRSPSSKVNFFHVKLNLAWNVHAHKY